MKISENKKLNGARAAVKSAPSAKSRKHVLCLTALFAILLFTFVAGVGILFARPQTLANAETVSAAPESVSKEVTPREVTVLPTPSLSRNEFTYSGNIYNIKDYLQSYTPQFMNVSGDLSATNANNDYTITVTIKDEYKSIYSFKDGVTQVDLTWRITRATLKNVDFKYDSSLMYGNTSNAPEVLGNLGGGVAYWGIASSTDENTIDPNTGAITCNRAGKITVRMSIPETENYHAYFDYVKEITIAPAPIEAPVVWGAGAYSEEEQKIGITAGTAIESMVFTWPAGTSGWSASHDPATNITVPAGTKAGNYTVRVKPDSNHCWANNNGVTAIDLKIAISRALIGDPSLSVDKMTYSTSASAFDICLGGTASSVGVNVDIDGVNWAVGANGNVAVPANAPANNYKITLTPDDNHCWDGGNLSAKTLDFTIERAEIAIPTMSETSGVYTAGVLSFTFSSVQYIHVDYPFGWKLNGTTVTSQAGVPVGNYTMRLTLDNNHCWTGGGTEIRDLIYSVTPAILDLPQVILNGDKLVYSLSSQRFAFSSIDGFSNIALPSGWSRSGVNVTVAGKAAAQDYDIIFTPDANHKLADGVDNKLVLTIHKAEIAVAEFTKSQITYSDKSQTVSLTSMVGIDNVDLPDSSWTRSGALITVPAGANSTNGDGYAFVLHLNPNYVWTGEAETLREKTLHLKISPLSLTINFRYDTPVVFGIPSEAPTLINVPEGIPVLWTVAALDTEVTIDENGIITALRAGAVQVTMTLNDADGNYIASTATNTVNIERAELTLEIANEDIYYGNSTPLLSSGNDGGGRETWLLIDGKDFAVIPSGQTELRTKRSGEVTLQLTVEQTANYNGATVTKTITIKKAPFSVTEDMTGDPQVPELIITETNLTYTGGAIQPKFSFKFEDYVKKYEIPASEYEMTWENNVNAGTGVLTLNALDTSDRFQGSISIEFEIGKRALALPEVDTTQTLIYNGNEQSVLLIGFDQLTMSLSGNTGILSQKYIVTITLTDPDNNYWDSETAKDELSIELEWEIVSLGIDASFFYEKDGKNPQYGGGSVDVTYSVPEGIKVTWSVSDETYASIDPVSGRLEPKQAGEVVVIMHLEDTTGGNFELPAGSIVTAVVTIDRANFDFSGVLWDGKDFVFDGNWHTVQLIESTLPAGVTATYLDNAFLNAGEYTAFVTFEYDRINYNAPDFPAQYGWSIKKLPITEGYINWTLNGAPWLPGDEGGLPVGAIPDIKASFNIGGVVYELEVTYSKVNGDTSGWTAGAYVVTVSFANAEQEGNFTLPQPISRDFLLAGNDLPPVDPSNPNAPTTGLAWWWYLIIVIGILIIIAALLVIIKAVKKKPQTVKYVEDDGFDSEGGFYDGFHNDLDSSDGNDDL